MKSVRQLLSSVCVLALLSSVGVSSLAQQPAPPPPAGSGESHFVFTRQPQGEPGQGIIVATGGGEEVGFSFLSSEMNFDGRVIKGAPYSAEAVTEAVQTLADGNRIVRKSTSLLYRDSEGRTRREQTLDSVGPFATTGDAPHVVFINDPVAGANYMLDARTHTARKATMFAYNFRTGGGETVTMRAAGRPEPPPMGLPQNDLLPPQNDVMIMRGTGERPEPPMGPPPMGARPDVGPKPPPPGTPRNEAIKRVSPVYPPVAKAAGAQGPVAVAIVIDEQGNVISAHAISGHPLLQQAAVDAAQQWVFKPVIIDGKPAKATGRISFSFVLDEKDGDGDARLIPPRPPQPKFPETKESLGQQTIEGVQATGTRLTVTIPAGAIGNEREIKAVTESWYSPELQVIVLTKHSDPRFGETTYRLININRSEPAHNQFEVPADYTIKEGGPEQREVRMKREKNDQ